MSRRTFYINGLQEGDGGSLWKWKGIGGKKRRRENKQFSVTEFLQENGRKLEEAILGPGGGFGIGCGVGVGLGVVGGAGLGGWGAPWNHLRMVFGIGMGCGVGLGFGYGQGIGYGVSLDSLRSNLFQQKVKSRNPMLVQI